MRHKPPVYVPADPYLPDPWGKPEKPVTTQYGRVVYRRKKHLMTEKDLARITKQKPVDNADWFAFLFDHIRQEVNKRALVVKPDFEYPYMPWVNEWLWEQVEMIIGAVGFSALSDNQVESANYFLEL